MRVLTVALLLVALSSTVAHSHTEVSPAEVKAMLDAGGDIVVVDVREESEFCDSTYQPPGHIVGAVNMPWNSGYLQAHYTELPADHYIIVVCRSGSRSHSAADFLDGVGFASVFDMAGGMNAWLWETEDCSVASVIGPGMVPRTLSLWAAAPNPFSTGTELTYEIPAERGPTHIALTVYDARGRKVATVVDGVQDPGTGRAVWGGVDSGGRPVASGVYFYRLSWDDQSKTRRVVLLK
jgi:rhodanese-related sulfurtransferase